MAKAKTKREVLREAVSKPRRQLTPKEREHLGKTLLSPKSELRKALFVLEAKDLEWLDMTVATLKSTRRRTNKSEMMKLGLSLLKQKSPEELLGLLRNLD